VANDDNVAAVSSGRSAGRRYPPLIAAVAALAIAALVLPSSLKVQQANPSETEQFAPVPPSDHPQQTQIGDLSSLSLGTSATLGLDATGGLGAGGGAPTPPRPAPTRLASHP